VYGLEPVLGAVTEIVDVCPLLTILVGEADAEVEDSPELTVIVGVVA
jgi:hypothetical protein